MLALQFIVFMARDPGRLVRPHRLSPDKLAPKTSSTRSTRASSRSSLNNWILLACAFFVLFATMFPTISEALDGSRVSVGPEFFNKWMTPLGLALLFLAGAAPLLAWRKTTRERLWNQFMFPTALDGRARSSCSLFVFPQTRDRYARSSPTALSCRSRSSTSASSRSSSGRSGRSSGAARGSPEADRLGSVHVADRPRALEAPQVRRLHRAPRRRDPVLRVRRQGVRPTWSIARSRSRQIGAKPGSARRSSSATTTFIYENLFHTRDDHKDAVTAQVSIWHGGERIATVYPAKWDYHKGDGQIDHRGRDQGSARPRTSTSCSPATTSTSQGELPRLSQPADPRGCGSASSILAFGTLVCLIPQCVVDKLQWKPKTRTRPRGRCRPHARDHRRRELGLAAQAPRGDTPPAASAGEHVPAGMGMGAAGGGYAAKNRPDERHRVEGDEGAALPVRLRAPEHPRVRLRDRRGARARRSHGDHGRDAQASIDRRRQAASRRTTRCSTRSSADYGEHVLATPRSKASWLAAVARRGRRSRALVIVRAALDHAAARPPPSAAPGLPASAPMTTIRRQARRRARGNGRPMQAERIRCAGSGVGSIAALIAHRLGVHPLAEQVPRHRAGRVRVPRLPRGRR